MSTNYTPLKKVRYSSFLEITACLTLDILLLSLMLYVCFLLSPIFYEIQSYLNLLCSQLNNAAKGIFHQ